jgi:hypothetical protein
MSQTSTNVDTLINDINIDVVTMSFERNQQRSKKAAPWTGSGREKQR